MWNYGNLAEGLTENAREAVEEVFPTFDINTWLSSVESGQSPLSGESLLTRIGNLFTGELKSQLVMVGSILMLAALSGLLEQLSSSFTSKGLKKMTFFFVFAAISALLVKGIMDALEIGKTAISNMVFFMHYDTMALGYLAVSSGSVVTGSSLYALVSMGINAIASLMESIVFPLISLSVALSLVHTVAGNVHFTGLSKLCSDGAKWLIGIFSTVFLALIGISGIAAGSFDGISGKTVKFAVGSAIPVVGGTLSEAMDTVIGSALMLKNTVGTVGMIILLALIISPIIRIGAIALLYRIAAAVSQPVADPKCAELLSSCALALTQVFAIVALVGILLLVSSGAMLTATNMGYALR